MRASLIASIASSGGGGAAVLPSENLILDVEPDLFGLSEGNSIVELTNSIVGENSGTQATGANRATYRAAAQGGKGAAEFDGTDYYDFGDIFDSLTAGSFYFYGKLNEALSGSFASGSWQPETASGTANYFIWAGANQTFIRERMFGNSSPESNKLGEDLHDQYFLYEVHASGTSKEMVVNGVTIYSTNANTFTANSGFFFGIGHGLYLKARTARVLGYSAAHNEASRQSVRNYIESYYVGDVNDHITTNIICEGTSITMGFPFGETNQPHKVYPAQLAASIDGNYKAPSGVYRSTVTGQTSADVNYTYNRRRAYRVNNVGESGGLIQEMIDDFATQVTANLVDGATNIVVLEAGTNDIETPQLQNAAYINGKIDEYAALCAGVGATLYIHHILPRGWDGNQAGKDAIRAAVAAHIDANYNAIPTPVELDDYADTTYFSDTVHLTEVGAGVFATATETALGL